jgi:hypothetical protein
VLAWGREGEERSIPICSLSGGKMDWKTYKDFKEAQDDYCSRCVRHHMGNCFDHKITLFWNDFIEDDGKPVGIDFYCENFLMPSGTLTRSQMLKK